MSNFAKGKQYTATNYRTNEKFPVTYKGFVRGVRTFVDANGNAIPTDFITDSPLTYKLRARNDRLHVYVDSE